MNKVKQLQKEYKNPCKYGKIIDCNHWWEENNCGCGLSECIKSKEYIKCYISAKYNTLNNLRKFCCENLETLKNDTILLEIERQLNEIEELRNND